MIDEESLTQVVKKRRRFAVEVGDGQVDHAVAVRVAASHAHARLVSAAGIGGDARGCPTSSKRKPPRLWNRKLAVLSLATNRSVRPSPSKSAATTPRPRPSRSTMPASAVTSTNRPSSLRKTWSGSAAIERGSQEILIRPARVLADQRVLGVPDPVVADVEVEVAVVVQVGERRRRRPVAVPRQAGSVRDVFECAVASVSVKGVRPPPRQEQIGVAVVIDSRRRRLRGRSLRSWRSIPLRIDTSSNVPSPRFRKSRSPVRLLARRRRESAALDGVDVEEAVAVIVDEADSAARTLGKLAARGCAVVENKAAEPGRAGVVLETGRGRGLDLSAPGPARPVRPSIPAKSLASDSLDFARRAGGGGPRRFELVSSGRIAGVLLGQQRQNARASKSRPSAAARRAISRAFAVELDPSLKSRR